MAYLRFKRTSSVSNTEAASVVDVDAFSVKRQILIVEDELSWINVRWTEQGEQKRWGAKDAGDPNRKKASPRGSRPM